MVESPDTEESDQLPEEAPAEQVVDDDGGASRDDAAYSAGAADGEDEGQQTGNPNNAG